ncbi:DUF4974 domain-containing protein [Fulvivirgaceae bacterium BMA10]|uniref:DUF4974 domain-containing protein n=1 Tax=Splendidivirga corallicola TaxID=3051826 RepID=A0ABT8KKN5_9BACT|nr:DUF4974 domain-containing protein [Fulvivirgaceae bacterium BMA10]
MGVRKTKINRRFLFFIGFVLFVSFDGVAQSSLFEEKVSFKYASTSLENILEDLTKKYNIDFSYSLDQLPLHQNISIEIDNQTLSIALQELFSIAKVEYHIIGAQMILKKTRSVAKQRKSLNSQKTPNSVQNTIYREEIYLSKIRPRGSYQLTNDLYLRQLKKKDLRRIDVEKVDHRSKRRKLQVSLVPGIGTNGMGSRKYINTISLNIFSGYSRGSGFLEIGGLSNFSTDDVHGIQLAGFSNVVGGDDLYDLTNKEIKEISRRGYHHNMRGFQASGLVNIVRGNAWGWQASAGSNVLFNSMKGFQTAGVTNVAYEYASGVQISGIWNIVGKSTTGVQLAGISNFSADEVTGVQITAFLNITKKRLNGGQIGAFNFAGNIEGKHSRLSSPNTGMQLGFFNYTKRNMDGLQIGLVNWVSNMNGVQFGLINWSNGEQRFPIGLLNISSDTRGYFRTYTSELFLFNTELGTGSEHVVNSISYSRNFSTQEDEPIWGLGYAFGREKYGRGIFINYDLQLMHINYESGFTESLSLLVRPRLFFGVNPFIRTSIKNFYVFTGVAWNTYFSKKDLRIPLEKLQLSNQNDPNMWMGFMFGAQLKI